MRLVKNRMDFSLYPNKRTYKTPDTFDNHRGSLRKGAEITEDGILTFATAQKQVHISDWNIGQ